MHYVEKFIVFFSGRNLMFSDHVGFWKWSKPHKFTEHTLYEQTTIKKQELSEEDFEYLSHLK